MVDTRPRIEVVWHGELAAGQAFADEVFRNLNFDLRRPLENGPGLSTRFWWRLSHMDDRGVGTQVPERPTLYIVLIDDAMLSDPSWERWLRQLTTLAHQQPQRVRLIPIVASRQRYANVQLLGQMSFQDLSAPPSADMLEGVYLHNQILISVLNFLASKRLHYDVFMNYVRADGVGLARQIVAGLSKYPYLRPFLDEYDLIPGAPYRSRFQAVIASSALLAVRSDLFSSRVEVVREFEFAKREGRPIVVLDAIELGEPRSFPYLGNCRTIRVSSPPDVDRITRVLLLEILRFEVAKLQLQPIADSGGHVTVCYRPPDLHSLPDAAIGTLRPGGEGEPGRPPMCVYPDPPFSAPELAALRRFAPDTAFLTPIQWASVAGRDGFFDKPLQGLTVQLSASGTPDAESAAMGFTAAHSEEATIEFARYLIAAGATIVFGGHFGSKSVGDWLLRILEVYGHSESPQTPRVRGILPFPVGESLSATQREQMSRLMHYRVAPPPDDVYKETRAGSQMPSSGSRDFKWVWARCLTETRRTLAREADAVILIGGKQQGFLGRYAGLVEEALFAVREKKPLYAVGCLGGCARAVYEALFATDAWSPSPAFDLRLQQTASAEFWEYYNARFTASADERIDYGKLTGEIVGKGRRLKSIIENGLDRKEQARLGTSEDLSGSVALAIKGLLEVQRRRDPAASGR